MQQFEGKMRKWLFAELALAGIKTPAEKYIENALKYSFLLSIFFWVFASLFFENLFFGFAVSACFFGANILFWIFYPSIIKNRRAQEIEKDLPFVLMNLSIELAIESRFEKALKSVCEKNQNALGKELKTALKEINEAGISLQEAMLHICERVDSQALKRAVMKIIAIYDQGGGKKEGGNAVRSIAKEELSVQRAKSKEFSQKLVLYSIMFIVCSAVFPALFLAFIIVGSSFMKLDFLPFHVVLIVTVLFPLFDVAALFFIRERTPHFLR